MEMNGICSTKVSIDRILHAGFKFYAQISIEIKVEMSHMITYC
jgi:hypothetical protein